MNFIKKAWLTFRQLKTWLQIVIVLVLLSLFGALGGSGSSSTDSGSTSVSSNISPSTPSAIPSDEPTVEYKPWYPSGFNEYQDGIAFKWTNGGCDFGRCLHGTFISRDGCPDSLYVEVNGFDKSNSQMGYTNDVTGSLAPMTQAKMTFNFTEDATESGRISKISCY